MLRVECLWFQRLKLRYDKTFSNFAFNFNLRRYIELVAAPVEVGKLVEWKTEYVARVSVGRCRLTPVSPRVDPR